MLAAILAVIPIRLLIFREKRRGQKNGVASPSRGDDFDQSLELQENLTEKSAPSGYGKGEVESDTKKLDV